MALLTELRTNERGMGAGEGWKRVLDAAPARARKSDNHTKPFEDWESIGLRSRGAAFACDERWSSSRCDNTRPVQRAEASRFPQAVETFPHRRGHGDADVGGVGAEVMLGFDLLAHGCGGDGEVEQFLS